MKSLKQRNNDLSGFHAQMEILSGTPFRNGELPFFNEKIKESNQPKLLAKPIEILQINVGYMCNQVCAHCHVDAGPDRKEIMTRETMQHCLDVIDSSDVHTLDLTGGAPEMNPEFRWFVEEASKRGIKDFIVRSNLTIIRANKKYYDLPDFFKKHNIHVISSMPHWTKGKTDRQRGDGVFDKSIRALEDLNAVGYGMANSGLILDLVYNPSGAFLPGDQSALELDFKKALKKEFNIEFNQLFSITNLPISRFLDYLIESDNYEEYMYSLVEAYNPAAVANVMCLNTLSVSWDGYLFDCDFNQMLNLKVKSKIKHIKDFKEELLTGREIVTGQHCYGCTAGAGSSCQGAVL